MISKRRNCGRLIFCLSICFFLLPLNSSLSQDYPTKPVNVMIGMAPGDSIDVTARILLSKAEKYLGQPIIVSNRPGGVGTLAAGIIAKSKPDGYNLACVTPTSFTRTLQLSTVPFKLDEFTPIMHYGNAQSGIVVRADSPWKTFGELVEYAKRNPGKLRYGTMGAWSSPHISMELVGMQEGIQWTHIPFNGSVPVITALLGGHVEVAGTGSTFIPHVKGGTLRFLANHGEKRTETFPAVPTFRDLGYDFINTGVFLFAGPRGIPLPVVNKLDDSFRKAMDDPEFIKVMDRFDIIVSYRNSTETKSYLEQAYRVHEKRIEFLKIPKIEEK
jgi:tripartite-type tricarboxylate transporter receptor subunit TctC